MNSIAAVIKLNSAVDTAASLAKRNTFIAMTALLLSGCTTSGGVGIGGGSNGIGVGAGVSFPINLSGSDAGREGSANSGLKTVTAPMPFYPAQAAARRINGSVTVRYDVSSDGKIENIEVINAEPPGVCERETLYALRNWQYVAGEEHKGITNTFYFKQGDGVTNN